MSIAAMIQARLGSKRFHAKIMQDVCGKTVLEWCYDRVNQSKMVDAVYVVAPYADKDLYTFCMGRGMNIIQGDENDVLSRYYEANQMIKANHVVRITSDCPLIDPDIIDELIIKHLKEKNDYTSNNFFGHETYPDGMDCEIIRGETLRLLWGTVQDEKHREHVTSFIRENINDFDCGILKNNIDYSQYRVTVDYEEDLELIGKIVEYWQIKNPLFGLKEIIWLLEKEPELIKINEKYRRNESYKN